MADVTTPFLDRATFEAMFRPLLAGERTLVDLLLRAATKWIVDRTVDIAADDPMAILVTFEVVRDALPSVPELAGRSQYTIVSDDRTESGTMVAVAGLLDFNERHRILLGISATSEPNAGGMNGDFGDVQAEPSSSTRFVGPFGNEVGEVIIGAFP